MNWKKEIIIAICISLTYFLIFIIAELWRIYGKPSHEQTRKLVHFVSGIVCLSFAYLFKSHWTVLILCVSFFIIMIVTKKNGLLRSVHDIDRKSQGGIYYPFAVYLTFIIAKYYNQPHYYLISILVLAVSDSLAAVIGKRYGFKIYRVEEDNRSLEGSIIFFTVTFIIVLLGLLLLTSIGREQCVLIAIFLGLMVTGFESISLGGTDNLFVPLGTIAILIKEDEQTALYIAQKIGVLVALVILITLIGRRTTQPQLGLSAIIGIALTGFAASSLVALHWLFPILIGIIIFSFLDLFIEDRNDKKTIYRIRSIFFILVVSFIWILVADFAGKYAFIFYVSYTTNITANLGILWHYKSKHVKKEQSRLRAPAFIFHMPLLLRAIILSLCFVPLTAFIDPEISVFFSLVTCFFGTIIIEWIYWFVEPIKHRVWSQIAFLRFTSVISITVTTILSIASYWYYREKIELNLDMVISLKGLLVCIQ